MYRKTVIVLILTSAFGVFAFAQDHGDVNKFKGDFLSLTNRVSKWEGLSPTRTANASMMREFETHPVVDTPLVKIDLSVPDSNYVPPERYKTRIPQSLVGPGILIVYGLTTLRGNGLYSSYQARNDLLKLTGGKGGPVDDYLIIAPYVEFGMLLLFKVQCKNDFRNTALLIVKSEVLMLALVYSLKYLAHQERPYSYQKGLDGATLEERKKNSSAFQSFPSGHTAEAFVAATIVYREYRHISKWYGIGAYALASTVGVFRMINDQHWQSDVLVGAGIGIISANVVYATHQHRWGRNEICIAPIYNGQSKGLLFSYRF